MEKESESGAWWVSRIVSENDKCDIILEPTHWKFRDLLTGRPRQCLESVNKVKVSVSVCPAQPDHHFIRFGL